MQNQQTILKEIKILLISLIMLLVLMFVMLRNLKEYLQGESYTFLKTLAEGNFNNFLLQMLRKKAFKLLTKLIKL